MPTNQGRIENLWWFRGLEPPTLGRRLNEETKAKISSSCRGKPSWNKGKRGIYSEETKAAMGAASLGCIPWNKGKIMTDEYREKARVGHLGQKAWNKGIPGTGFGQRIPWNKGKKMPAEHIEKRRNSIKKVFADPSAYVNTPEYHHKRMSAMTNKPSKPELLLLSLIKGEKLPFEYTGDGKVIIEGKCPDFFNSNGRKQIIELYGDYWHRNNDPKDRISFFSKYGFQTLILWESEVRANPSMALSKIRDFTFSEGGVR